MARNEIPIDTNLRAPAPLPTDWRRDTELGRQISNSANALGGMGAVTQAPGTLRALNLQRAAPGVPDAAIYVNSAGQASQGGTSMSRALVQAAGTAPPMAPANYAYGNLGAAAARTVAGTNAASIAAGQTPTPGLPALPTLQNPLANAPGGPQSAQRALPEGMTPSGAGAGRGFVSPLRGNPAPENDVPVGWTSRDVAGASGVRRMTTPDGRTLYTNVVGEDNERLMSGRPGLQVAPAIAPSAVPGAGSAGRAAQPAPQTEAVGIRGSVNDDLRAKMDAGTLSVLDRSTTRAERMQARQLAADAKNAEAQRRVSLRGQDMSLEGQRMGNEVALRGQNITADGQLLNANVALRGQELTAQSARNAARIQQMNADRTYQLDVAKFGEQQAQTRFDQREKGQKSFDDWAGSLFMTKNKDGMDVPDAGKKSEFIRTSSVALGSLIAQLQQKGDPASLARADELSKRGLGALDAEDKAMLKTLFDRRERFLATRGNRIESTFGAAEGPVSDDLTQYAFTGDASGLIQSRLRMAGGQTIGDNDLRYTDPANAILPDWMKTPTTNLGPTAREREALKGIR